MKTVLTMGRFRTVIKRLKNNAEPAARADRSPLGCSGSAFRCRRAARDGNVGVKLSLDHFVAAVLKIKYEYETELRANSCLLTDSRGGNKSLKLIPHNPLHSAKAGSAYYTESA